MRTIKIIIILALLLVACNSKTDFSDNLENTSEIEITPTTLVPSAYPPTPTAAPKEPELVGVYGAGVIAAATRSPDGKILVYLENGKTLRWVDTVTWEEIGSRDMSGLLGIDSLIFSPDGSHLLLDDSYKPIVINLETGEKTTTIKGEKNERGFAFSNDNRYVVFEDYWFGSGSGGGNITLWDTATDQVIHQFPSTDIIITPNAYMTYPVISPDDQLAAAGCFDQQVYIWDLHTGETLRTLGGGESKIISVAFSQDGLTLAVAYSEGVVNLWNTKTWARFESIAGFREYIERIEFSLDSENLVVHYRSSSLYQTWNRETGEIQDHYIRDLDQEPFLVERYSQGYVSEYFYHGKESPWISFSPDGRTLLSTGDNILLWDIATGELIASLEGEGPDFISRWKYSPDGTLIGTLSYYAGIRIWNAENGELISNRVGIWGFDTPDSFIFLGDSNLLALSRRYEDSIVEIWDYITNQQVASLPIGDHNPVEWLTGMSYSDEKRELEVTLHSQDQRVVQTWDMEDFSFIGQEIINKNNNYQPNQCYGILSSIECVSPDGKLVVEINLGKIQISEQATSKLVYSSPEIFTDYTNTRAGITFSPDSRLLAFSNIDGKVTVWNLEPLFGEVGE